MIAIPANNDNRQRSVTAHNTRRSAATWEYARPEKRTVEGRASTGAVAAKGRSLSQFSHGLTGRCGTTASMPDARQDADLPVRILAYLPDTFH
jgi:hypothetical protein